ncbi:MAG: purine-nucleoside phosphorylase, partial [Acidobacteriaceae bacterium]
MAETLFEKANAAAEFVLARTELRSQIGIVLGSGLGAFAEQLDSPVAIPFSEIPHFPQSTVPGHSARLVIGKVAGVPVAVMQGRVHAYEGYSSDEVAFPVRVLGRMGVRHLV